MIELQFGEQGNAAPACLFGWSAQEDGYAWTVGNRCALLLDLPDAPFGYELEILWSPFVANQGLDAQAVTLFIGGRRIATEIVREPLATTTRFRCPPARPDEKKLLLEFDLPDAAQPSKVAGHQTDDRMLALCFRRITLHRLEPHAPPSQPDLPDPTLPKPANDPAPEPPTARFTILAEGDMAVELQLRGLPTPSGNPALIAPGNQTHDILFGTQGNATPYLRGGWSTPEPGGIWTDGPAADLTLPPLAQAETYELQLALDPFVPPRRPTQRIILLINDMPVADIQAHAHTMLHATLPAALFNLAHPFTLTLELPDAATPLDMLGTPDERLLGALIKRAHLTAIPKLPHTPPLPPSGEGGAQSASFGRVRAVGSNSSAPTLPNDELMLRFESLGENCEFGLVQRACGVEPLGLLRFASAPLPRLLAALRDRFAGMGSPENLGVELSQNGREYMIQDEAFGFNYHAWVKVNEQSPGEILKREARRVPFLIRKLIEDMEQAEKIFIYHAMHPMNLVQARTLSRAIRQYGPATLLWIEEAPAGTQPNTIIHTEPGLLQATITRFAPTENAHDLDLQAWQSLCRAALQAL